MALLMRKGKHESSFMIQPTIFFRATSLPTADGLSLKPSEASPVARNQHSMWYLLQAALGLALLIASTGTTSPAGPRTERRFTSFRAVRGSSMFGVSALIRSEAVGLVN